MTYYTDGGPNHRRRRRRRRTKRSVSHMQRMYAKCARRDRNRVREIANAMKRVKT
ncbi:MAG: hypothetical protein ACXABY_06885 [Candidatus Thorarchaeota archaeon]|jgi:hypothetical protein